MTTSAFTPCNWPVQYPDCGQGVIGNAVVGNAVIGSAIIGNSQDTPILPPPFDTMSATQRQVFEQMASDYLYSWTGSIFGLCEASIRPCRADACCGRTNWSTFWGLGPYPTFTLWAQQAGYFGWFPVLIAGEWHNCGCGVCPGNCSCPLDDGTLAIRLPGPVSSIIEVYVDGVLVPETAYTLEGNILLRTDGGRWPMQQDLYEDWNAKGSFLIRYNKGLEVPVGGQLAAGLLAIELAKQACGGSDCVLTTSLTSISRQGVSLTMIDPTVAAMNGWTGIKFVDDWLNSIVRPRRPRTSIMSPERLCRSSCNP